MYLWLSKILHKTLEKEAIPKTSNVLDNCKIEVSVITSRTTDEADNEVLFDYDKFYQSSKINLDMASVKEIQLKYHSIACCCGLMTSKSPNVSQYKTENIFSSWRRDQYTCIKKQGFVMRIYNSYSIR